MQQNHSIQSLPDEALINKIRIIRGKRVMIDSDLAELYGVETKRLKEQVKRNMERFPHHYMFELTRDEYDILRSQIATLETEATRDRRGAHTKYLPYAFTEHGILQLSNVLRSNRAIQMSIRIIDIFIKMREMLLNHKDVVLALEKVEKQVTKNSEDVRMIFAALKKLLNPSCVERTPIGFKSGK